MKIISELTNNEYSTVEECLEDEKAYKAKEEEKRKAEKLRLEEKEAEKEADKAYLDELRTTADDALDAYRKALIKYNKKYKLRDDNFDRLFSTIFGW